MNYEIQFIVYLSRSSLNSANETNFQDSNAKDMEKKFGQNHPDGFDIHQIGTKQINPCHTVHCSAFVFSESLFGSLFLSFVFSRDFFFPTRTYFDLLNSSFFCLSPFDMVSMYNVHL